MFFHYLYNYLLKTYTTPITKDIINTQTQKYKNIINMLNKETDKDDTSKLQSSDTTNISKIPQIIGSEDSQSMEHDLLQHALSEI